MRLSSKLALAFLGCSSLILFSLVAGVTGRSDPPAAVARTGTFRLAMIQVSYTDASSHIFSVEQLRTAGDEINAYFDWLSYGNLDFRVRVMPATVSNTRAFYWSDCAPDGADARDPCPPPLIQDAAEAAAAAGLDFSDIDGIMLVNPWCQGDWTNGPIDIDRPGVRGRFQRSYDFECTLPAGDPRNPPGASGVWWGGWAHELGHQLQFADGFYAIHPGGYASGYDLMDSCYPCHESVYGLTRPGGDVGKAIFPDWLPSSKIVRVEAPGTGTRSTDVEIAPIELRPDETTLPMGVRIPISSSEYYLVDARERRRSDTLNAGPGIYDEGIEILYVAEGADPPVIPIDSCDSTVPGRCVRDAGDPRAPSCNVPTARRFPDAPAYCWPFPLFHVGEQYTDTANNITIRYVSRDDARDSHRLTIERGVVPGRPDVMITPWLTPPMNAYETIDIWVDSSCNGYESDVGARGLRYGRRGDGTVVGNGDDPCANHENRVYARVRNLGDAPAINVLVAFERTDPMGVGIWGAERWVGIASASPAEFSTLASIPPGEFVDVYVLWTPVVDLSGRPPVGRFNFHTCIRVKVRPTVGETLFVNQDGDGEQENIDVFEAVIDPVATSASVVLERETFLSNPYSDNRPPGGPRTFHMIVRNDLPPGWSAIFGSGRSAYTLAPNELRRIPIRVISGPGPLAPGQFYSFHAEARTLVELTNPAIPPGRAMTGGGHFTTISIGGATYMVHIVEATDLTLDLAIDGENNLVASGKLTPPHQDVLIAIDYTDSAGNVTTHLAPTAADGSYQDRLCPTLKGTWRAIAFWQGDLDHASATSPEKQIEALSDCGLLTTRTPTPTARTTPTPRATPTFQTAPATVTPTRTPTPQTGQSIRVFTAVPNCQIDTVSINWQIDNPGPNLVLQLLRNGLLIQTSNNPTGSFVDQIQKGTYQYTLMLPNIDSRTVSVTC